MLSRQVSTEEQLVRIVQTAHDFYSSKVQKVHSSDVAHILEAIKEKIDSHGFTIVKRLDERDGAQKFLLISKVLTNKQREVEEDCRGAETRLFYEIVDMIMQSSERRVDTVWLRGMECSSRLPNVTYIVEQWFRQGWLTCSEDGLVVSLGVRALAEIESFLIDKYHLPTCALCDFILFTNSHKCCSVCQKVFHNQCFSSYADSVAKSPGSTCPFSGCNAPLSDIQ
ncbi:hypothetical protein TTRE_0000623901 [Trichuris trichiura]|uniref:Uncharacterized protein n=1 Tax=Trichuris trichiura TaxID=36087 RepID=A0A077ZDM6_TRITR|nr:hypothetical protein TTRE_0000623901 [Trichuris trichiura]